MCKQNKRMLNVKNLIKNTHIYFIYTNAEAY